MSTTDDINTQKIAILQIQKSLSTAQEALKQLQLQKQIEDIQAGKSTPISPLNFQTNI